MRPITEMVKFTFGVTVASPGTNHFCRYNDRNLMPHFAAPNPYGRCRSNLVKEFRTILGALLQTLRMFLKSQLGYCLKKSITR